MSEKEPNQLDEPNFVTISKDCPESNPFFNSWMSRSLEKNWESGKFSVHVYVYLGYIHSKQLDGICNVC